MVWFLLLGLFSFIGFWFVVFVCVFFVCFFVGLFFFLGGGMRGVLFLCRRPGSSVFFGVKHSLRLGATRRDREHWCFFVWFGIVLHLHFYLWLFCLHAFELLCFWAIVYASGVVYR